MAPAEPVPALSVRILGEASVSLGGRACPRLEAPLLLQLIARLVIANRPILRRDLARCLWPGKEPTAALADLRQLPARLKAALPDRERWIQITPEALAWAPTGPATVDLHELEALLTHSAPAEVVGAAMELYRGPLLAEHAALWVQPFRRSLATRFHAFLLRAAEALKAAGQLAEARRCYERVVQLAPEEDEATAGLIQACLTLGDHDAARQALARHSAARGEPGPATRRAQANLSGPSPAQAAPALFVGRATALVRLDAAWREAAAGRAALLNLRGPPGIGCSALAVRFAARVRAEATVVSAVCLGVESPYGALASLAAELPLAGTPAGWRAELSRLVPELREADPTVPAPAPLTDPLALQAFHRAITRAFLHRPPLLVVLDAAAQCDPQTRGWYRRMITEQPSARVLVLLVNGPPTEGTELAVGPLSPEESAQLVRKLCPSVSAERAAQLAVDCGGNPLLLTELAKDPGNTAPVRARVLDWIRGAGPAAAEVAEALAVLGSGGPELLPTLVPDPALRAAGWDGLVATGLVQDRGSLIPIAAGFVADAMPSGRKALLHHRLAVALAAEDLSVPARLTALLEQLAQIPRAADVTEIALGAAARLRAAHAFHAATPLLDHALRVARSEPALRWQVRLERVRLAGKRGLRELVDKELRDARDDLAWQAEPVLRHLELLEAAANVAYALGDVERAIRVQTERAAHAEQAGERATAASAWLGLSTTLLLTRGVAASEEAVQTAARLTDPADIEHRAVGLAQRSANERYRLRLHSSARSIAEACALTELAYDRHLLVRCACYQATTLCALGQAEAALRVLDALPESTPGRRGVDEAMCQLRRSAALRQLERCEEALDAIRGLEGPGLLDDQRAKAAIATGEALTGLGRYAEAHAALDACEAVPGRTVLVNLALNSARLRLLLAQGRLAAAEALAAQQLPYAPDFLVHRVELLEVLGRARLAAGDHEAGIMLLEQALALGEPTPPGEAPAPHRRSLRAALAEARRA